MGSSTKNATSTAARISSSIAPPPSPSGANFLRPEVRRMAGFRRPVRFSLTPPQRRLVHGQRLAGRDIGDEFAGDGVRALSLRRCTHGPAPSFNAAARPRRRSAFSRNAPSFFSALARLRVRRLLRMSLPATLTRPYQIPLRLERLSDVPAPPVLFLRSSAAA